MDINIILILTLTALVITLTIIVFMLHARLSKFLRGRDAKSLEEAIYTIGHEIEKVHNSHKKINNRMDLHDKRLRRSIKDVKTIRFNPFADSGGNQSFAISLVNEEGDGVILSSLYSREKTSVFAKPIQSGHCEYELTKEETEVLKESQQ